MPKFIENNNMWITNPEQAKLLLNPEDGYKYTQCSGKKVDWKCPNCGNIIKNKRISDVHHHGLSCPICSDGVSYPEKFMYNLLKQLNVDFEYQKKFDWCKFMNYKIHNKINYGIYDFVIEPMKLIIETDGGLGHGKIVHSKTHISKEESIYRDNIKTKLAIRHNYKLLRIDCIVSQFYYLKRSILHSELSELFDLSQIDWEKCGHDSLKSCKIMACNYWNKGFSTLDISHILQLHQNTITRYLKDCNEVGLCKYNSKDSYLINNEKARSKEKIKVRCISTGEIFDSIAEADRKYNAPNISNCCYGKRKSSGKLNGIKLQWEFVDKNHNKIRNKKQCSILQFSINNIYLHTYVSLREASRISKINKTSISDTCKGKQKTAGGYIWKYSDDNVNLKSA